MLSMVPMMENNFYAPTTIKRWQQLDWNDFQGFVKPFSKWGAVISSNVYVEFDSTSQTFVAFAGQNNQRSWTKAHSTDSASSVYMLNHEQYHFNITEVHARMMNEYLLKNPDIPEGSRLSKLAEIRVELNKMQDAYDEESDHSLVKHRQRRWEYQIDSLLREYSDEPLKTTDYYSGATIFFPVQPSLLSKLRNGYGASRIYTLSNYDMILALESAQFSSISVPDLNKNIISSFEEDSLEILSFLTDTIQYTFDTEIITKDSTGEQIVHYRWVYHEDYLYRISAGFAFTENISGYEEIAKSFINSFEITDTDTHWRKYLTDSDASMIVNDIIKETTNDDKDIYQCATYGQEKSRGFFRAPFFTEEGEMILAYDIIAHEESVLYENAIIIDDEWYSYQPNSADQVFFVPAEKIPTKPFQMKFGYFLAEDTVKECLEYYYQSIMVYPPD